MRECRKREQGEKPRQDVGQVLAAAEVEEISRGRRRANLRAGTFEQLLQTQLPRPLVHSWSEANGELIINRSRVGSEELLDRITCYKRAFTEVRRMADRRNDDPPYDAEFLGRDTEHRDLHGVSDALVDAP